MTSSRWPYPRVLAHRGAGVLAPENTLAALRVGWEHGFRAVECDAMLTADEVPVLIHDATLGRTVRGTGAVAALQAAELRLLDAGSWFDQKYAGEKVPLLSGAMEFCRAHAIFMNIEIKPSPGTERRTGEVVAGLVAAFARGASDSTSTAPAATPDRLPPPPLLSSFSEVALRAAQAAAPGLARAHLFDTIPGDWEARLAELGCTALHCNHKHLTAAAVGRIAAAGLGVFCYTVNDVARARELLGWGVDGFCTDRIDLIAADFATAQR